MNNRKMLYFNRIDDPEGIDVNETSASRSASFVIVGIFQTKGLYFSHLFVIAINMSY